MPTCTSRILTFIEGLQVSDRLDSTDIRYVAHATLASHPDHVRLIDSLLEDLVKALGGDPSPPAETDAKIDENGGPPNGEAGTSLIPDSQRMNGAGIASPASGDDENGPDHEASSTFSSMEILRRKDFACYSSSDIQQAAKFLRTIQWRPSPRRSRRRKPSRRGSQIDVRQVLRKTLRTQGEMVQLYRAAHQLKERKLVLLCDISGSMEAYTKMLLHFAHSLSVRHGRIEIFLFGTRLTRVTHIISASDADNAIQAISSEVNDWDGGTRIGEAIGAFHRTWARRITAHGSVIMLISDGWDRGDPTTLGQELARLQRLSHRLIWLNPLLGSSSYEPLTRGMQTALPYVDDFLPVHNLKTLEELASSLNSIDARRPARHSSSRSVAVK